jgi:hypothetical protein
MPFRLGREDRGKDVQAKAAEVTSTPGKRTLTEAIPSDLRDRAVQRSGDDGDAGASVHAAAQQGIAGPGSALPHLDRIQTLFGPNHDVSHVQAHVGGPATAASAYMGAQAYATGDHVAFAQAPSLHLAAHEAAHTVQQRAGVQLSGGVGQAGDRYERHADDVADLVVQGKSAAGLLDLYAGGGDRSFGAVQKAVHLPAHVDNTVKPTWARPTSSRSRPSSSASASTS